MRKFLSLFLVLMIALVLTACGNDNKVNTKQDVTKVTFTSWGLGTVEANNILRRQIAKFNETHTNIQIEIVEYEGDYNAFLATKASAGEFPDIVMVGNVPEFVIKDWIGDISEVAKKDADWYDIPVALRDSITYGDKIFAVPAAYHYLGYYANLDLIEDAGNTAVFNDFTYTTNDFFNAISSMKDASATDGSGTIGITNTIDFVNFLPAALDPTGRIGHFVWNGTNFEFNGQEIKTALAKSSEMTQNGETFDFYSADKGAEGTATSERETKFGYNDGNAAFYAGNLGFIWDASWAASARETGVADLFNYDFVGLPEGKVIGVSDYYGISKSTQNKAAAYEAVKYLTFGSQGILDTFDIIENARTNEKDANGNPVILTVSGLPINERSFIVEKWFESYPQPGFKNAYLKAKTGEVTVLMEGNKYIPGFTEARFTYNTGIPMTTSRPGEENKEKFLSIGDLLWDAAQGYINYSQYMTQELADAMNAKLNEAQQKLAAK